MLYVVGEGVKQNSKKGVRFIRDAANSGLPDAQHRLGDMYANGEELEKDLLTAYVWMRKAATQGYPHAEFYLGHMHAEGFGTRKSLAEAVRWYIRAAKKGDADAQLMLGSAYARGSGIAKDRDVLSGNLQRNLDWCVVAQQLFGRALDQTRRVVPQTLKLVRVPQ